jgi:hypothetical protein
LLRRRSSDLIGGREKEVVRRAGCFLKFSLQFRTRRHLFQTALAYTTITSKRYLNLGCEASLQFRKTSFNGYYVFRKDVNSPRNPTLGSELLGSVRHPELFIMKNMTHHGPRCPGSRAGGKNDGKRAHLKASATEAVALTGRSRGLRWRRRWTGKPCHTVVHSYSRAIVGLWEAGSVGHALLGGEGSMAAPAFVS